MFCKSCGAVVPVESDKCPNCGDVVKTVASKKVGAPDYVLIGSIIVTCCCCQPAGLAGVILAVMANSKLKAGDVEGAERQKKLAMWISIIGAVLGFIFTIAYLVITGAGALAEE